MSIRLQSALLFACAALLAAATRADAQGMQAPAYPAPSPSAIAAFEAPASPPAEPANLVGPNPSSSLIARPRGIDIPSPGDRETRPLKSLAVGFTAGISGLGIDLATPLADRYNLRVGASFLAFSATFHEQGVPVLGEIHLASGHVILDYAPTGRSFHISPGIALYNRDHYRASVFVAGGSKIIFNDQTYYSDPTDPIRGEAIVPLASRPAPRITVGWGNMIRHRTPGFSFPVEIGFEYIKSPTIKFDFAGSTCDSNGMNCTSIANDPETMANIAQDQHDVNNELKPLRFFPILTFGVSYKFGH